MRPLAVAAVALGCLCAAAAAGARAAPAPAPVLPPLPPKTVAPVTVTPHAEAPRIVRSFPAAGEVIAPGALVLHITFDQDMEEEGFAFAAAPGAQMPQCLKTPRLLNDARTFVLLCTTAPKTSYVLSFNATPHAGFASVAGRPAVPAQLAFSTNDAEGPDNLDDALKIAKLTSADVPIATQP